MLMRLPWAFSKRKVYEQEQIPISTLVDRVRHVVQCFLGRVPRPSALFAILYSLSPDFRSKSI